MSGLFWCLSLYFARIRDSCLHFNTFFFLFHWRKLPSYSCKLVSFLYYILFSLLIIYSAGVSTSTSTTPAISSSSTSATQLSSAVVVASSSGYADIFIGMYQSITFLPFRKTQAKYFFILFIFIHFLFTLDFLI